MANSVMDRLGEAYQSLWVLSVVRTAYDRGVLRALAEGDVINEEALSLRTGLGSDVLRGLLDCLCALELAEPRSAALPTLTAQGMGLLGPMEAMVFSDLHSTLGLHAELWTRLEDATDALEGWSATDARLVDAQARHSEAVTSKFDQLLTMAMPGFNERVARGGAKFLDLGAGAAGALVAFARLYPRLHVVGIEPSPVARQLGRKRIAESGVADRVELRAGVADDITEENEYACIYVAQMFFPEHAWRGALPKMLRALEPGASVVTAATCRPGDDLGAALSRFKTGVWGGGRRTAERLVTDFLEAGFAMARVLPVPGPLGVVLAQKAP